MFELDHLRRFGHASYFRSTANSRHLVDVDHYPTCGPHNTLYLTGRS